MPSSQSKWGLPFGNLFTLPGLSSKETKGKQVQLSDSVIVDEDFCSSVEITELDTSVSISLYEQLVADCLKGETFAFDDLSDDEDEEEARELEARTLINTIIVVSTTDKGRADISRADKSLPHKSVSFASDLISGPGKGYHNERKEARVPRESLIVECGFDSDSDSRSIESTETVAVPSSDTPAANIIEKAILCNCPAHKNCLTCRMTKEAFSLVLKESNEDLSLAYPARWIVALSSLNRVVRLWVSEHVTKNPHIGPDKWQTPVSQVDKATVSALKDMINIAQGIAHLRGKRARHVVNNLRKAIRVSKKITSTLQILYHTPAADKKQREKLAKRFTAYKADVKLKLNTTMALLETMHNEIKTLLKKRIMPIRADILRNFEQSNIHWPRSSARKTRFIAEVLINVYRDSRIMAVRLKEMYDVWEKSPKTGKLFQWYDERRQFIVFWGYWMTDIRKGLAGVAARAEVLDRKDEQRCREGECRMGSLRRKKGGLLLAG